MQIEVKAYPLSKKKEVVKTEDLFGNITYKVYVNCAPEDGKANKQVTALLCDYFKTNQQSVKIIKGEHSRNKIVRIGEIVKEANI
jgi:uncharacterized protein (TIGR00251 family)